MCGKLFDGLLTLCHVLVFPWVRATVDLNIHEIQYIADHLPEKECRELAASLHTDSYALPELGGGAGEPQLTCIELLVLWDQTEGKNKTFHHLTHRLRQLGEAALANKISKTVYHEESSALKRLYLDDPFKKIIPKNSALLDNGMKYRKKNAQPVETEGHQWNSIQLTFIISGGVCAGVVVLLALRLCCMGVFAFVAPVICPPSVLSTCNTTCDSVTNCCSRCKSNTHKHLLGAGHGRRSAFGSAA